MNKFIILKRSILIQRRYRWADNWAKECDTFPSERAGSGCDVITSTHMDITLLLIEGKLIWTCESYNFLFFVGNFIFFVHFAV